MLLCLLTYVMSKIFVLRPFLKYFEPKIKINDIICQNKYKTEWNLLCERQKNTYFSHGIRPIFPSEDEATRGN